MQSLEKGAQVALVEAGIRENTSLGRKMGQLILGQGIMKGLCEVDIIN